jgi:cytochrome P450
MSEIATSVSAPEFYFNPWDENFRANPYPHYKPLMQEAPRIIELFEKFALVARFADVRAVLLDHERFSSVQQQNAAFQEQIDMFQTEPSMLFSDPPVHTRLRRLISRDFTPRRVRELEPRIREIATVLLDAAARRGKFDVIADLATPLPVMVIAEMLGVPPELYQQFKAWSDKVVESDNVLPGMPMPDDIKQAFKELRGYFAAEIEKRRAHPGADLVSALVAAHDKSDALSEGELLEFVVLLLLAGNETTTNLIGNGMLALGRHPEQLAALRSQPELMARAIEEMLRYDGPVQATFRTAACDTQLGGTKIPKGMGAFVLLAAANRDPAEFPDPDRFDITRETRSGHLAFGEGIHYCVGSGLARLEASIAIGQALARFPKLSIADPGAALTYKGSFFLRGLAALQMKID